MDGVTLDKMKRSLAAWRGSFTLYLMVLKNNTDIISAADAHDVGCLKQTNLITSETINYLLKVS